MIHRTCIRLAAVVAALASQASARADLSWFDVPVSEDRPHVSFADVVAWSDACLDIKAEEWAPVERVYAEYITRWSGEGNDEEKLWQGLASVLGPDRSGCLDAFRSSTDLVLRTRDSSNRHVAVRRELLALAATRGQFAADARRIAREISGRVAPVVTELGAAAKVLVGETGVALSILRPSGRAQISEGIFDVMTNGEFLEAGTKIQVLAVNGQNIIVGRQVT
jgi:membrane protein implicated in regulation of membrane protease activity